MREALRLSQVDVPGPVFVELPVDILYPYSIISEQFTSMARKGARKSTLKSRIVEAYTNYSLNHIFADAWKEHQYDPLPITIKPAKPDEIKRVVSIISAAKRPLVIVGSQSVLRPYGPTVVAEAIKRLGVPIFVNGSARGLLGQDYPMQFRHARKEAIQEADCVLLLGAVCDFRLSYGQMFKRHTKVISVNRSLKAGKLNARIFWHPEVAIESDVGTFVKDLVSTIADGNISLGVDKEWLKILERRDREKDESIRRMSEDAVDKHLNPLKLLMRLRDLFKEDDTILVADGGDFVASASYIMKPFGPLRWLDPGPFGTLGCGAGFALAAKLLNPTKHVVAIMGDGAFGYSIAEIDTFVRHKVPVYWLIGNDACWTQIAREQVPMLGSSIGCQLAYTDYHRVAEGFGAKGFQVKEDEDLDERRLLSEAKKDLVEGGQVVVVNSLIGKTKFRDGSISV